MISIVELKKRITEQLKQAENITVLDDGIKSGFKGPAFFLRIIPIGDHEEIDYIDRSYMIIIIYWGKEKNQLENLQMVEKLNRAFKCKFPIQDRVLLIKDKSSKIIDNILEYKFNLNFIDWRERILVNGESINPERLEEELGYRLGNIQLIKELKIEEEYNGTTRD